MSIIDNGLSKAANTFLLPGLDNDLADVVRTQFFLCKENLSVKGVKLLLDSANSAQTSATALSPIINDIISAGQNLPQVSQSDSALNKSDTAIEGIDGVKFPLLRKINDIITKSGSNWSKESKEKDKIRAALTGYLSLFDKFNTPNAIMQSLRFTLEDVGKITAPYRVSEDAMKKMSRYVAVNTRDKVRKENLEGVVGILQLGNVELAYELTKGVLDSINTKIEELSAAQSEIAEECTEEGVNQEVEGKLQGATEESGDTNANQTADLASVLSNSSVLDVSLVQIGAPTSEHQDITQIFLKPIEQVKKEIDKLGEAKSNLLKLAKDLPEIKGKIDVLLGGVQNTVSNIEKMSQSSRKGIEVVSRMYDNRASTIAFLLISLASISGIASCAGITKTSPLGLAGAASFVGLTLSIFMLAFSSVKMYQAHKKEENYITEARKNAQAGKNGKDPNHNVTEAKKNGNAPIYIVRTLLCCAVPALAFLSCIVMSVYEVASGTKIAERASVDPRILTITAMVLLIICVYGVTAMISQINAPEEAQRTDLNEAGKLEKEQAPNTSTNNGEISSVGDGGWYPR